jgi:5'-methylthioadenosine phosphorylase
MQRAQIGIIGGSGLYDMPGVTDRDEANITTPFGEPSAPYLLGTLRGKRVAFLARHGGGHRVSPSELNFRANIFGMKTLGVEFILSASAVGSLKEEYRPADIVIPDQFFDRTKGRPSSFFGRGLVGHVGFAHPFCKILSGIAYESGATSGATIHKGGTYVCMEGPQFSTLAESKLYRSWGMDIIGMTNLQEAKLAREAEICLATMALATDYDCWNTEHGDVEIEDVLRVLSANVQLARRTIARVAAHLPARTGCPCPTALENAIITERAAIPAEVRRSLGPILARFG